MSAARSRRARCPGLLPGGRPVADPAARARAAPRLGRRRAARPRGPGHRRDPRRGGAPASVGALVVGGVETADLPDPALRRRPSTRCGFVVSLELRPSAVTDRADVVLPGRAPSRRRPAPSSTGRAGAGPSRPRSRPTRRSATSVGSAGARHAGRRAWTSIGLPDVRRRAVNWTRSARGRGERTAVPPGTASGAAPSPAPGGGARRLAAAARPGLLQDGDVHLAGTRHPAVARLSPATAAEIGAGTARR